MHMSECEMVEQKDALQRDELGQQLLCAAQNLRDVRLNRQLDPYISKSKVSMHGKIARHPKMFLKRESNERAMGPVSTSDKFPPEHVTFSMAFCKLLDCMAAHPIALKSSSNARTMFD